MGLHRMGWGGVGCGGAGWNGAAWDGMGRRGMGWGGVGWDSPCLSHMAPLPSGGAAPMRARGRRHRAYPRTWRCHAQRGPRLATAGRQCTQRYKYWRVQRRQMRGVSQARREKRGRSAQRRRKPRQNGRPGMHHGGGYIRIPRRAEPRCVVPMSSTMRCQRTRMICDRAKPIPRRVRQVEAVHRYRHRPQRAPTRPGSARTAERRCNNAA